MNGIITALICLQILQFILFGILFSIQSDRNGEMKKRIKKLENALSEKGGKKSG